MSSKSLNKVFLIGNLTRDPSLKVTPNGASICTFSVATNSQYRKPDNTLAELTEYHNIVAWSKLADICAKKLRKGDKVYLEGELRTRILEDMEASNKKVRKTEVRITEMILMKNSSSGKDDEDVSYEDQGAIEDDSMNPKDTLPF